MNDLYLITIINSCHGHIIEITEKILFYSVCVYMYNILFEIFADAWLDIKNIGLKKPSVFWNINYFHRNCVLYIYIYKP